MVQVSYCLMNMELIPLIPGIWLMWIYLHIKPCLCIICVTTDGVGLYISSFRAQVRIRMERSDQIASTCKHYWFCIITNMKDLMFRIFKIHKVVLSKALLLTASWLVGPVWARGNPSSPLSLQFPTSPSSTVSFSIFFLFPFRTRFIYFLGF